MVALDGELSQRPGLVKAATGREAAAAASERKATG
jgi:hypothetical protein